MRATCWSQESWEVSRLLVWQISLLPLLSHQEHTEWAAVIPKEFGVLVGLHLGLHATVGLTHNTGLEVRGTSPTSGFAPYESRDSRRFL